MNNRRALHRRRRQACALSGRNMVPGRTGEASAGDPEFGRRASVFQIQRRVAERHPQAAGEPGVKPHQTFCHPCKRQIILHKRSPMLPVNESDWKLFRKRLPEWQGAAGRILRGPAGRARQGIRQVLGAGEEASQGQEARRCRGRCQPLRNVL